MVAISNLRVNFSPVPVSDCSYSRQIVTFNPDMGIPHLNHSWVRLDMGPYAGCFDGSRAEAHRVYSSGVSPIP